MKKIILIICLFVSVQFSAQAQADVQVNPVALLFGGVQLSADFLITESISVEASMIGGEDIFAFFGAGKYYFNPQVGADRFFVGAFVGGGADLGGGLGFLAGHKWLSAKGISFELALGAGRGLGGDLDVLPYGKLAIGYRFGNKESQD